MLDTFRNKYTPDTLPYHLIVPSLVGYTLFAGPPTNKTFKTIDIARIMNKLLLSLGFESGYISQGGDIGSFTAQCLANNHKECKAIHGKLAQNQSFMKKAK